MPTGFVVRENGTDLGGRIDVVKRTASAGKPHCLSRTADSGQRRFTSTKQFDQLAFFSTLDPSFGISVLRLKYFKRNGGGFEFFLAREVQVRIPTLQRKAHVKQHRR